MSQVILGNGTAVATELPARAGWSPQRGPYQIRTWQGPHSAIKVKAQWLQSMGYSYELRESPSGLSTIEATTSDPSQNNDGPPYQNVVENWELRPNKVQKDILESHCAAVNALTEEDASKLRKYLDGNGNRDVSPAFETAGATDLFRLITAGVKSWEIPQVVLVHTITVPLNYTVYFNYGYMNRIMSVNALMRWERLPFDYLLPMRAIAALFVPPTRLDGVSMVYGWKKGYPTLAMSSQGRRELQIDYEFGLWPTLLYGALIA